MRLYFANWLKVDYKVNFIHLIFPPLQFLYLNSSFLPYLPSQKNFFTSKLTLMCAYNPFNWRLAQLFLLTAFSPYMNILKIILELSAYPPFPSFSILIHAFQNSISVVCSIILHSTDRFIKMNIRKWILE